MTLQSTRSRHLFVDTNVFLSFYDFTDDDLESLSKLKGLLKERHIQLFVTDQVKDEFYRNRESKIKCCLNNFDKIRFSEKLPRIAEGIDGYDEINSLMRKISKQKSELINRIKLLAKDCRLKADLLIEDIFKDAASIAITPEILGHAKTRIELGNPPGKSGSLGDAINWEAILLCRQMEFEDLNIVSIDMDFASPLNENELNKFLRWDYEETHYGYVRLFRSLRLFLESNVPEIVLSTPNDERASAVTRLCNSGSFAETHHAISALAKFSDFEIAEVEQLLDALQDNDQVGWIKGDLDINKFYRSIISEYQLRLTPKYRKLAAEFFQEAPIQIS